MKQRPLFLSSLLILLLGFFSSQGTLTGHSVQDLDTTYDLNHDGLVDQNDLQEAMYFASYHSYDERADFNSDGIIDQLDVDILTSLLATNM